MTTSDVPIIFAQANDADFRLWGKAISDMFTALGGFAKTADTGQVDWATVTQPASNTNSAYEIRVFSDTAQSTLPIYVKIFYVRVSTPSYHLVVSTGTGSDGAGNLTGTAYGAPGGTDGSWAIAANSGTDRLQGCSDGSGFYVKTGAAGVSGGGMLCIDRFRDAAGAANTRGYFVYGAQISGSTDWAMCQNGMPPFLSGNYGGYVPWSMPRATTGTVFNTATGQTWVSNILGFSYNGPEFTKMLIGINSTTFNEGQEFTVTRFGGTKRYKVFKTGNPNSTNKDTRQRTDGCFAGLWE